MVTLSHISKSYAKNGVKAVDDLSFTIEDGEIFGFIGPNGAGKTTTIKMMIGVSAPDNGTIDIDGTDMATQPLAAKEKIGFVPDSHDMFDRLTGLEYLNFIGDMYGVPKNERAAAMNRYADMFELSAVLSQQVRGYSHGMKQKLMVIGALLHKPRLWVLDEPLLGLDPLSAKNLKDEMRRHCAAGNMVFFSSHVLEVVEKLCDRIGVINNGRLIAVGTLEELRARQQESSLEQVFLDLTEQPSAGENHA